MNSIPERLNKKIALWLGISRRQADDLIASGRVLVEGKTATLGQRISESEVIKLDNKPVDKKVNYQLLMLNKPTGYTSSRASQKGDQTVYNLLPNELSNLKLVGRLDKNSSGLILLTNNGDFAYQMTHPKFHKTKVYLVELDYDLEPLHQQMISDNGVILDDGRSQFTITKTTHEEVKLLGIKYPNPNSSLIYQITMSEGRNRQIRRTFLALGYTVTSLHRINFGNYFLGGLELGQWQEVKF